MNLLRARDIEILEEWIRELWPLNAVETSLLSHGRAWQSAAEGEEIPYQAALLSDEPLSDEDVAWAKRLIEEQGWDASP